MEISNKNFRNRNKITFRNWNCLINRARRYRTSWRTSNRTFYRTCYGASYRTRYRACYGASNATIYRTDGRST